MFCPSCGKDIPDASLFCLHCGKPIAVRKRSGRWVLYLLTLIAGITIIIVVLARLSSGPSVSPSQTPVAEKLFSGQIVVRAGQHVYRKFNIDPSRMQDVRVVGSFQASGGSGNDIQVVLAEESEFENWKNRHEAHVLYSTGQITTGKIDVPITQTGTYYLVFSNAFSLVSDKDVFTEIELRYAPK